MFDLRLYCFDAAAAEMKEVRCRGESACADAPMRYAMRRAEPRRFARG